MEKVTQQSIICSEASTLEVTLKAFESVLRSFNHPVLKQEFTNGPLSSQEQKYNAYQNALEELAGPGLAFCVRTLDGRGVYGFFKQEGAKHGQD